MRADDELRIPIYYKKICLLAYWKRPWILWETMGRQKVSTANSYIEAHPTLSHNWLRSLLVNPADPYDPYDTIQKAYYCKSYMNALLNLLYLTNLDYIRSKTFSRLYELELVLDVLLIY